ncbi:uncharacterized protein FIESC28_05364 [Fusarium coffeatum]|uniref:Protein kinase domain-containing protein n=1 Tax=Fusarium coffeatum TaxID=231269 RepID=A0A366RUU0_9HYPO|nr:uncharacterized protein FIESC28_05364 [Fusarium coffeatum]RBR20085.1 hypothetical protein FIESC28_05364 [Fusarium coffeatum]
MPAESVLYLFGPFPNEDPSTNMNPLPEISSYEINHQSNDKKLRDSTLKGNLWIWESTMYEALGPHEHILTLIGLKHCPNKDDKPRFLKLEKSPHGNLHDRIIQGSAPPMATRMRMVLNLAETLQHIHSQKIIWGALCPQYLLLFDSFHMKLSCYKGFRRGDDFFVGACELDTHERVPFLLRPGYEVTAPGYICNTTAHEQEMFMLGSCICEITEWAILYSEIDRNEYEEKLRKRELPPVRENNLAKDVIQKLWKFKYSSAEEVSDDIRKLLD